MTLTSLKRFAATSVLLIPCLTFTGCIGCNDDTMVTMNINGMLNNQSKDTVHMWIGEDSQKTAAPMIEPGGFRMSPFSIETIYEEKDKNATYTMDDKVRVSVYKDVDSPVFQKVFKLKSAYKQGVNMTFRWDGKDISMDY